MIVLDTHVLVWWVSGGGRLSSRAKQAVQAATRERAVRVSAISLFEVATAVRRGRLLLATPLDQWLADVGLLAELRVEPVTAEIAALAGGYDDAMPRDPADRIIVATAQSLGFRLISADRALRKAPGLSAIW